MTQTERSCPNCGTTLGPRLEFARMLDCESCGTTVVLDDAGLRAAGDHGVLLEAPSLLRLGQRVRIDRNTYLPVGMLRFDYGAGWWDEFWCQSDHGDVWISADEGDYALERPLARRLWPVVPSRIALGRDVSIDGKRYTASEIGQASCVAFRGGLPEVIALGERHDYVNFGAEDGALVSLERWPGGQAWALGDWIDPWDIEPLDAMP